MLGGIVDAETQHDFVDKQGFGKIGLLATEIGASLKYQLVYAGDQFIALEDGFIDASIGIGALASQFLSPGINPAKYDIDPGSRQTERRIKNMCGQSPHFHPLPVAEALKSHLLNKLSTL
jgi:hypothetical protein